MHTTKGNLYQHVDLCEHGADEFWTFECECGYTDGFEYDTRDEVTEVAREHKRQMDADTAIE